MKTRNTIACLLSIAFILSCKKDNAPETPVDNPLDSGLIAYYPLNGDATDKSGNGYNLTVSGPAPTADRFGKSNSAYKFNGVSDYMVIPGLLKADSLRRYTISMWVKPEMVSFNAMISMYSKEFNNCSTSISISTEGSPFVLRNKALYKDTPGECIGSIGSGTIANLIDSWHHIVLVQTYNETSYNSAYTFEQYYDGNKAFQTGSTVGYNTEAISFINGGIIGGNNNSGNYTYNFDMFKGDIDEVRIYNKALSPAEVQQLFTRKN